MIVIRRITHVITDMGRTFSFLFFLQCCLHSQKSCWVMRDWPYWPLLLVTFFITKTFLWWRRWTHSSTGCWNGKNANKAAEGTGQYILSHWFRGRKTVITAATVNSSFIASHANHFYARPSTWKGSWSRFQVFGFWLGFFLVSFHSMYKKISDKDTNCLCFFYTKPSRRHFVEISWWESMRCCSVPLR